MARWISIGFLLCMGLLLVRASYAQSDGDAWAEGQQALEAGQWRVAMTLFQRAAKSGPHRAEAHYGIAQIYHQQRHPKKAYQAIGKALEYDAANLTYLVFALERLREFLPDSKAASIADTRRPSLAGKILRIAPDHPLALDERALTAYLDEKLDKAAGYLERAIAADPHFRPAYERLLRVYLREEVYDKAASVARQMKRHFPEEALPWGYAGLVWYRQEALEEAEAAFEEALSRLSQGERAVYEDVGQLIHAKERAAWQANEEGFTATFWAQGDPRLLTPQNERKLEHYARMFYADLFFGNAQNRQRGWLTDPGQLIVRYGIPLNMRTSYALERESGPFKSKVESRFQVWQYAGFSFGLIDEWRNHDYIFPDEVDAHDIMYDNPQQFIYETAAERVAFPYLVSVFKGTRGWADVYVPYGIPLQAEANPTADVRFPLHTGAFLLDAEGQLRDEARRTPSDLPHQQIHVFDEAALWMDVHWLQADTGRYALSVEFETAGQQAAALGFHRGELVVPSFTQPGFKLSDLLLAYQVEDAEPNQPPAPGWIQRGSVVIQAAPWGVFEATQPLYLYFEMYDLAQGPDGQTAYEVEALLAKKETEGGLRRLLRRVTGSGEGGTDVSVRFARKGNAADEGQYLIFDTAEQLPGTYTLLLRVTDLVRGETVEVDRTLVLE